MAASLNKPISYAHLSLNSNHQLHLPHSNDSMTFLTPCKKSPITSYEELFTAANS